MSTQYPVAPLGRAAHLSLAALLVLPFVLVVVGIGVGGLEESPGFAVVLLVLVAAMVALVLVARRRSVTFDGELIVIKAALYTRQVALAELDLDASRVMDLREHTEFKPILRTNGMSVPGFHAGHYRTRDLTKAFALLTTMERVLVLREREGGLILLSLERSQLLLDALRG